MSRKTTNLNKPSPATDPHGLATTRASTQPQLPPYIGYFAIGYVLASALFMLIQTKLALNAQLVTVLSIILAAYIAVSKFVKHQQRALYKDEINRLMLGGIMVVWLLTGLYFLALWFLLFDDISREVLLAMAKQQPLPLLSALVMIVVLSLVSARISIWAFNRLLDPARKTL